jgi:FkbM family methyltransferase
MANIALENVPIMSHAKTVTRTFVPRTVRNWLRSPSASARWVYDEMLFCFGVRDTVVMRPGWEIICHPAAVRCAYFAQQNDPAQVAEFESFLRHSSSGMMLLDIGAHFGLFSLAALHYGGPTACAVAIDPSPVAIRLLNVQARLNRSGDRLNVIQASVEDHAGWQDMVAVGVLASGYYVPPPNGHPESELIRTRAVTLDGIVDELRFKPSHIKIDVEGREAAVLRGGRETLSTTAPILFLEIHNEIVRGLGGDVGGYARAPERLWLSNVFFRRDPNWER